MPFRHYIARTLLALSAFALSGCVSAAEWPELQSRLPLSETADRPTDAAEAPQAAEPEGARTLAVEVPTCPTDKGSWKWKENEEVVVIKRRWFAALLRHIAELQAYAAALEGEHADELPMIVPRESFYHLLKHLVEMHGVIERLKNPRPEPAPPLDPDPQPREAY